MGQSGEWGDQGDPNFYNEWANVPKEQNQLDRLREQVAELRNSLGPVSYYFELLGGDLKNKMLGALGTMGYKSHLLKAQAEAEAAWAVSKQQLKNLG